MDGAGPYAHQAHSVSVTGASVCSSFGTRHTYNTFSDIPTELLIKHIQDKILSFKIKYWEAAIMDLVCGVNSSL